MLFISKLPHIITEFGGKCHDIHRNEPRMRQSTMSSWINKPKKNGRYAMMRRVRLGSVFSGIGAVEHALERMGIQNDIIFACDNNKFVKESYFANYDIDEDRWFDDILKIDGKKYKNKIDLLVGGSPCQSFSMVGNRLGTEDPRGLLIYRFIDLVKDSKPNMFVFENVRGLMSHNGGRTWRTFQRRFEGLKYSIHYKILNSKDYGLPQNRDRLFVVGFKDGRDFEFPERTELALTMKDLLEDTPNPKYMLPEKGIKFVTKLKNLKKRYTQINGDLALCQKANQQFNWHGDFIIQPKKKVDKKYTLTPKVAKYVLASGTKNYYSRPKTDLKVARPLLQTMHKCHRAGVDNYITGSKGIRRLTPRECLRLMGFDDTFRIEVSDLQAYRQSGNSIAVNVLMALLSAMLVKKK